MHTVSGAVLLVFVASLAVLDAERAQAGAQIIDFGQAMWWSITTITTVGYGDLTPLTTTGRVVAVLLMIGGISLVGSITATLASWIVERVADEQTAEQVVTTATHRQGARRDRAATCPGGAFARAIGARHRKVRQVAAAEPVHRAKLPTWTVQQARPGCS